jgi:hypothetical protein
MGIFFGNSKTADGDDSDYGNEEYPQEYDNEFDALNAPSDMLYEMNTFDFIDG